MANIFRIDRPTNKITLGTDATTIVVTPLTASKTLALNASKELESVQDIRTTASPAFAGMTLTGVLDHDVTLTADNTFGLDSLTQFDHAENITLAWGTKVVTKNISAFQITNKITGASYGVIQGGDGLIAEARGLVCYIDSTSTGDITWGYNLKITTSTISSTGTIDTLLGIYIDDQKIAGVTAGYGIYQKGTSDLNYFAGNTGIGVADPHSKFEVNGAISSATLTFSTEGPTDNVDISGVNTLFLDCSANDVTIGGFTGGVSGQVLYIARLCAGAFSGILEHIEGGGSQDIYLHAGLDETLNAEYGGWILVCNGTSWFDTSHAKHV